MKSKKPGINTLKPPIVTGIDRHGLWLLLDKHEYFLDYKNNPWFLDAKIADIFSVEMPSKGHIRWDNLDVDLEVESLNHPEKYPLTASTTKTTRKRIAA